MEHLTQDKYAQGQYRTDAQGIQSVVVELESLPVEISFVEGSTVNVLFPDPQSTDIISSEVRGNTYVFHHETQKFSLPWSILTQPHREVLVELPCCFRGDFSVTIKNGAIVMTAPSAAPALNSTRFSTTNGPITLEGLRCSAAVVHTKNGAIDVAELVCGDITLNTYNGPITGTIRGTIRDYAVESRTLNGRNNLPDVPNAGQAKKLTVKNRNGLIDVTFTR